MSYCPVCNKEADGSHGYFCSVDCAVHYADAHVDEKRQVKRKLGIEIFPRASGEERIFKCKPWKLSAEAEAHIKEIEDNQRRAWRKIMTGDFWLD